MNFPESFWWGTAASSPQSEGAAQGTDWLAWEQAGRAPVSGDGNGFATRYREDFELYARYGLPHHRLGIEWARIEPERGRRDARAVAHYRSMLEAANAAGIKPWVCLHHFVFPEWLGGGGFMDPTVRELWRRHVEFIAETYGDLVFGWKPINEPIGHALTGYMVGRNPPGQKGWNTFLEALEATHLAKYDAARILHPGGKPIATIHVLIPLFAGDDTEESREETDRLDRATWGCWIDAIKTGVFELPGRKPVEVPDFGEVFDLAGFSYYFSASVTSARLLGPYPPDGEVGPSGYVPWSEGIGLVCDRLHNELPQKPILISEHGVGTMDDEYRCRILDGSVRIVADRLARGYDIRGFFHWTGVDNYEWTRGFNVPFGLFDKDRNAKGSAELMRNFATGVRAR
jgi:beta-glucosidase